VERVDERPDEIQTQPAEINRAGMKNHVYAPINAGTVFRPVLFVPDETGFHLGKRWSIQQQEKNAGRLWPGAW
jgi:hypothetical protein